MQCCCLFVYVNSENRDLRHRINVVAYDNTSRITRDGVESWLSESWKRDSSPSPSPEKVTRVRVRVLKTWLESDSESDRSESEFYVQWSVL